MNCMFRVLCLGVEIAALSWYWGLGVNSPQHLNMYYCRNQTNKLWDGRTMGSIQFKVRAIAGNKVHWHCSIGGPFLWSAVTGIDLTGYWCVWLKHIVVLNLSFIEGHLNKIYKLNRSVNICLMKNIYCTLCMSSSTGTSVFPGFCNGVIFLELLMSFVCVCVCVYVCVSVCMCVCHFMCLLLALASRLVLLFLKIE